MKRGIIILAVLFLISCVSALPNDSLHLTVQSESGGTIESGTYTFNFTIYTDSLCTAGIYSREFTRATDSRGIADFYLDNTESIDFSSQLYLGYYRGGVLKNCSEIARIPYSNTAGRLLNESNQNIGDKNFTASWFKGLFDWTTSSNYLSFDGSILTMLDNLLNTNFNQTQMILDNNASWTSTYNETYAGLINNESYLSTFNQTYHDKVTDNESWSETYANTLYLPHTTIWDTLFNNTLTNFLATWLSGLTTDDLTEGAINKYDNQSWNETRGNELYSGIEWDYNQTLGTYNLWNEEWSSTYNETYSGLINNASYLSTFNSTYHDKVSYDSTNVAYKNETNTFTENQTIQGDLKIGTDGGICNNGTDMWFVVDRTQAIADGEYCS